MRGEKRIGYRNGGDWESIERLDSVETRYTYRQNCGPTHPVAYPRRSEVRRTQARYLPPRASGPCIPTCLGSRRHSPSTPNIGRAGGTNLAFEEDGELQRRPARTVDRGHRKTCQGSDIRDDMPFTRTLPKRKRLQEAGAIRRVRTLPRWPNL